MNSGRESWLQKFLSGSDERWEVTSTSLAAGDSELNSNSARALSFSKKLCILSESRTFLPRSKSPAEDGLHAKPHQEVIADQRYAVPNSSDETSAI